MFIRVLCETITLNLNLIFGIPIFLSPSVFVVGLTLINIGTEFLDLVEQLVQSPNWNAEENQHELVFLERTL